VGAVQRQQVYASPSVISCDVVVTLVQVRLFEAKKNNCIAERCGASRRIDYSC
jgi:hypothetical protein